MKADGKSTGGIALAGVLTAALLAGAWYRDARRRQHALSRIERTHIEVLLNVLTAGDVFTAEHSRRVADLTDALAETYGFSGERHARLRIASLLHDMGKIDDQFFQIIHSRDKLSQTQRRRIERHPAESAHILEPLERLHPGITAIVSAHHEHWNGGGYPEGLQGDEIPLEARLISVADVFDAMTQARSYRDPLDPEQALEEICAEAGSKFDPEITRRLREPRVRRRWEAIAAAHE